MKITNQEEDCLKFCLGKKREREKQTKTKKINNFFRDRWFAELNEIDNGYGKVRERKRTKKNRVKKNLMKKKRK